MSSDSIFCSNESEKRWVLAMSKNFPQQHTVHIDFDTPCVFRVPKPLTEEKPEAYAPHKVGLGPYHHLQSNLYTMQKHKLAAIRKFLSPEKLQNFQQLVEALVQFEPLLRACYDQYLDLDIETLAWIVAIDGLYLLQFLKYYPEVEKDLSLTHDILMLENQIPVVLLNKILQFLELENDISLFEMFDSVCLEQSPLNLSEDTIIKRDLTQTHLVHRMHYLILNKTKNDVQIVPYAAFSGAVTRILLDDVVNGVQFLADRGLPGAAIAGQILSFVQKIPWDRILGLLKKQGSDEQNPLLEEIDVPSVSQMSEIVGIKFTPTLGGIRDIEYDDSEEVKRFYLPVIRLTALSEVVLRNLVAYEAASAKPGSTLEMGEYVDLMCGIVDSTKDVDILRKEGILDSELVDDEIMRIFNGIGKSRKKNGDNSNIEEAIVNVNAKYDSLWSVKVKRFSEKYVCASFRILAVLITIAVMVLVILQAFCSVFGCGHWFDRSGMQMQNFRFSN